MTLDEAAAVGFDGPTDDERAMVSAAHRTLEPFVERLLALDLADEPAEAAAPYGQAPR